MSGHRRLPNGEKKCAVCGNSFAWFSWRQNFCSAQCRFVWDASTGTEGECWNWRGPRNEQGYGFFFFNGERVFSHRFAYEQSRGAIPENLFVLHRCDNPSCTNPAHLWLGTRGDNNADRSAKGRSGSRTYTEAERQQYSARLRGPGNANAKLTEDQATAIKYRHPDLSNRAVARLYGVSKPVATHIRTGRSWKYL